MNYLEIENLRRQFPKGTKVKCLHMEDPYHPIPRGTIGEVTHIDDAGTIHVSWQNGSSLGLIPGEDSFQKVPDLQKKKSRNEVR